MNGLERRNGLVGNAERPRRAKHGLTVLAAAVGAILGTISGVGGHAEAQTPSFNLVGMAPGAIRSHITAISPDGRVAAGYNEYPIGSPTQASFTWTASGGRSDFGLLPGVPAITQPYGLSFDGATVVGYASFPGPRSEAFRYQTVGGYQALPLPGGFSSSAAAGVSGDGTVIAGAVNNQGGFTRPARWTPTGPQVIPLPHATDVGGGFTGVSRDGSTLIGIAGGSTVNDNEAYKWTAAGGWTMLPAPAGTFAPYDAMPNAVTADGLAVVGNIRPLSHPMRAVLWRSGLAIDLGAPIAGWSASAGAITDDGNLVVGAAAAPSTSNFILTAWTAQSGTIFLTDYLSAHGLTIPAGWTLRTAGVSADGLTFAGDAIGPNFQTIGYIATIPAPSTLLVSIALGLNFCSRRRR